jgi:uncharacterized protein
MSPVKRGAIVAVTVVILSIAVLSVVLNDSAAESISLGNEGGDTATIVAVTDAPTPGPTPTRTPVPPDVELHPLSIDYLRNRTYEGSDLVVEQTLPRGVNYDQYVVSYDSDGLKIYALLTVPRGDPPPTGWPVVIFNHGYIPPDIYRTTERYEAYVDAFARVGYIVLKSDYRGHGFSEGDPESAYSSPGYTIDVLNALAAIRRFPSADVNRIGMWGHSMGGWITMRAMVVDPDIRAGVIWGGVVGSYDDLFEHWWGPRNRRGSVNNWRRSVLRDYTVGDNEAALWASLQATSYLNEISGPIQLHHARGDATVPYALSVVFDGQLRDAGQHSELLLYQGDDHNISRNRDLAFTLSVVFFDEYVKNID